MSILYLKDVAHERVCGKTLAESILGLFEVFRFRIALAKLIDEELV